MESDEDEVYGSEDENTGDYMVSKKALRLRLLEGQRTSLLKKWHNKNPQGRDGSRYNSLNQEIRRIKKS